MEEPKIAGELIRKEPDLPSCTCYASLFWLNKSENYRNALLPKNRNWVLTTPGPGNDIFIVLYGDEVFSRETNQAFKPGEELRKKHILSVEEILADSSLPQIKPFCMDPSTGRYSEIEGAEGGIIGFEFDTEGIKSNTHRPIIGHSGATPILNKLGNQGYSVQNEWWNGLF